MSKRLRYLVSSAMSAMGFFLMLRLPYESIYFGLGLGVVLTIISFWFGLSIIFSESLYTRLMVAVLPLLFFVSLGLFLSLLPLTVVASLIISGVFLVVIYTLFLVENVFLVAIGYRRVPLYRAAYTVSLMILLLTSFFLFDGLFSYRLDYWWNVLLVFLGSCSIFMYQFWAITIELPDDGKNKSKLLYVVLPSIIMAQLALAFSFWPVGIFKGSVYLVFFIYLISALLQAEVRERLFVPGAKIYFGVGVAAVLAIMYVTSWRNF